MITEFFSRWERDAPNRIFLRQPVARQWREFSYANAGREIRSIAAALQAMGLEKGARVAILSKNCAHWIMADLAILMAGFVSVPLYATLSAHGIRQILEHSGAQAIFIGKLDEYGQQKEGIPAHVKKISFPWYGPKDGEAWSELVERYPPLVSPTLHPDDLATLMYTSGTTGVPKGVMFNHRVFSEVAKTEDLVMNRFGLTHPMHLFSFLPLSHIAERNVIEILSLWTGSTVSFVESLDTFAADLSSVQPHVFFAVPRIWAKFQEKIFEKLPPQRLNTILKIPVVGTLLKNKIKKGLGLSRAVLTVSGAAPMPIALLRWYQQLGITIREVYGMTENGAISHGNLGEVKFGTVGQAWPGVEVRLSAEGEVQTRHGGTMQGYYQEPQLTREVFTEDGFLKTGDQGSVDAQGYLTITGRIKDLFKTDKGKYVAPAPIEMKLLTNPDIEKVCVVGMGIPQPIALTILSALGKAKSKADIESSLSTSLQGVNATLESYEKLETAVILQNDWTVENGLMTPTLKNKRNEIEKLYLARYPQWYHEPGLVVWE